MPPSGLRHDPLAMITERLRSAGCVFAEDEARLIVDAGGSPADIAAKVDRRIAGYPLEHILGWAEFGGLRIELDAGVFVPRRRTEVLVNEAVGLLSRFTAGELQVRRPTHHSMPPSWDVPQCSGTGAIAVDLCCGSGAAGAVIASRVAGLQLHAADIDPAAVACARRNVGRMGGEVHQGDLFDALPRALKGHVSVLTANAPYVPTAQIATMPREARDHEPLVSLDGGADGLDLHRRVASGAGGWLHAGGFLLIETSEHQARQTASILANAGFTVRTVRSHELDGTVIVGRAK